MKFLCDRCKTRYSIADERVRGKILKIRCKNCSAVISVREGMEEPRDWAASGASPVGGAAAPAAAPSLPMRPPPASLHEEWYVSLDGNQEGPFLLPEAQAWVAAKSTDDELHCWCEGFDDWLPVEKVSHFRGLRGKVTRARTPTRPGLETTPPPRAEPPPAARRPEPEPKPLFAATLAALEADAAREAEKPAPLPAAPATPATSLPRLAPSRATPIVGSPNLGKLAMAVPRPATPAASAPPLPAAAMAPRGGGGSGPVAAVATANTAPVARASLPLPRPIAASSTGSAPSVAAAPSIAAAAAPLPGPIGTPAPARPAPMFDTGESGDDVDVAPPSSGPAAPRDPIDEIEDDLSIGEVSRVVRLSDVAATVASRKPGAPAAAAAAAAAARNATAAQAAIARGTGAVTSMDATPAAAGVDAYAPAGDGAPSMYQMLAAQPPRKRTLLYVGAGVVVLALLAVVIIVATSRGGSDDEQVTGTTRSYDDLGGTLQDPFDRRPGSGSQVAPAADAGVGGTGPGTGRRPGSGGRPGSGTATASGSGPGTDRVENPTIGPDGQPLRPLSPDDVFAMSTKMEIGTRRCYERAMKDDPFLKVTKIKATVVVKATGTVSSVNLSSMQGTPLASCLAAAIGRWRFRPSTEGIVSEFALVFEQR